MFPSTLIASIANSDICLAGLRIDEVWSTTQTAAAPNLFAAGGDQCCGTLDVVVRRGGADGQTQRTHGGGMSHAAAERLDAEAAFEFVEATFHSQGIESEGLFGCSGIAEATTPNGNAMLARQPLDTFVVKQGSECTFRKSTLTPVSAE